MNNRIRRSVFFTLCCLLPFTSVDAGNTKASSLDSIAVLVNSGITDTMQLKEVNRILSGYLLSQTVNDSIMNYAQFIVERARRLKSELGLADALQNLFRGYLNRYESSKSLEFALEAYKLYEKNNDHAKMAYMLMQLGVIYYTQNNYAKSLEYYNNSVTEFEKIGDKSYIATLFYLSGINYSKLHNYASALSFFNRAKSMKLMLGDEKGIAECNIGLADLYLSMGKPDSAIFYLDQARLFTSKANNVYGNARADILKSEAHFLKHHYDSAQYYAYSGMDLAATINARELIVDAEKILYRISADLRDYQNAYLHLMKYMTLRDSIINEKTTRSFSRLEGDYLLGKKQSEILLLEKENRNRTLLLRATVIIGILALMLSLLYYNKNQIKQKANQELKKAYHELETTQQQLVQQEKLASLGQLTAGIAHEIKNPLNFVNNFSALSIELLDELKATDDVKEKESIIGDLQNNIEKIAHHGDRANSIITRMLEHSRTGKRELELTDINKLIKEYVQLAYKALQIKQPGFSCHIGMRMDERIPKINLVSQEISRVLLNIFNNCMYAIVEKKRDKPDFKPELSVTTQLQNDQVVVVIKDNGPGIPEHIMGKIFQPFFTTKPAGEGTGLGLSISFDIVKAHGGNITVSNNPEEGASFTVTLPVKTT